MGNKDRSIVKEALDQVDEVTTLAVERAKNELIEQMSPMIRGLVEKQIRRPRRESVDRVNDQGADYYSPSTREKQRKFEEDADKEKKTPMDKDKDLDMESLAGMFPGLTEEPDPEEAEADHAEPDGDEGEKKHKEEMDEAIPTLGEEDAYVSEAADEEEGDMDETVEISEAELAKVYNEAIQTEAQVSKGFKDMSAGGELDDVVKDTGIADKKSGEAMWDTKASLPPDRKDFTVKEIKQLVQQGIAENKALRGENVKLKEMVKKLASSLKETNLFNAKVMQVNKLFTRGGLTAEQKRSIVESIDAAESISEVKKIGVTLERTLKSVGVVAEGAKRKSVSQRAGKSGGADQKVLRESVDKGAGSQQTSRWEQLAGLK